MGKTVVIIGNGDFPKKEFPKYTIGAADVIICCDGAFLTYLRHKDDPFLMGRMPDIVIGDMDSTSKSLRKKYADIMVHVEEQDYNDQTKAFRYALENIEDIDVVHFIGATGKREDHTIGNISLLMEYMRMFPLEEKGINIDMISDYSTILPITDSCTIDVGDGRAVSIISPDNTLRIHSEGLVWQTDGVVFDNWWKATLNKACNDRIELRFNHKSIALVILN